VNSPFTKAAFDEGVQDLLKGNVKCYRREHGPPTRGQLANALDLVPKTVQFHLTGLAALGVVIPDPAPDPARRRQRTLWGADNRFQLLSWSFVVRLRSGSVLVDQSIHHAAALESDVSWTVGNQRGR
jgi:hypothetical protein